MPEESSLQLVWDHKLPIYYTNGERIARWEGPNFFALEAHPHISGEQGLFAVQNRNRSFRRQLERLFKQNSIVRDGQLLIPYGIGVPNNMLSREALSAMDNPYLLQDTVHKVEHIVGAPGTTLGIGAKANWAPSYLPEVDDFEKFFLGPKASYAQLATAQLFIGPDVYCEKHTIYLQVPIAEVIDHPGRELFFHYGGPAYFFSHKKLPQLFNKEGGVSEVQFKTDIQVEHALAGCIKYLMELISYYGDGYKSIDLNRVSVLVTFGLELYIVQNQLTNLQYVQQFVREMLRENAVSSMSSLEKKQSVWAIVYIVGMYIGNLNQGQDCEQVTSEALVDELKQFHSIRDCLSCLPAKVIQMIHDYKPNDREGFDVVSAVYRAQPVVLHDDAAKATGGAEKLSAAAIKGQPTFVDTQPVRVVIRYKGKELSFEVSFADSPFTIKQHATPVLGEYLAVDNNKLVKSGGKLFWHCTEAVKKAVQIVVPTFESDHIAVNECSFQLPYGTASTRAVLDDNDVESHYKLAAKNPSCPKKHTFFGLQDTLISVAAKANHATDHLPDASPALKYFFDGSEEAFSQVGAAQLRRVIRQPGDRWLYLYINGCNLRKGMALHYDHGTRFFATKSGLPLLLDWQGNPSSCSYKANIAFKHAMQYWDDCLVEIQKLFLLDTLNASLLTRYVYLTFYGIELFAVQNGLCSSMFFVLTALKEALTGILNHEDVERGFVVVLIQRYREQMAQHIKECFERDNWDVNVTMALLNSSEATASSAAGVVNTTAETKLSEPTERRLQAGQSAFAKRLVAGLRRRRGGKSALRPPAEQAVEVRKDICC